MNRLILPLFLLAVCVSSVFAAPYPDLYVSGTFGIGDDAWTLVSDGGTGFLGQNASTGNTLTASFMEGVGYIIGISDSSGNWLLGYVTDATINADNVLMSYGDYSRQGAYPPYSPPVVAPPDVSSIGADIAGYIALACLAGVVILATLFGLSVIVRAFKTIR